MARLTLYLVGLLLFVGGVMHDSLTTRAEAASGPGRLVYLGGSSTDGNTYPLLIDQALQEAGKPVPVWFNAGVGGNTAKDMLARLERDVFVHKPTIVTISAGVNDASNQKISVEDFRQNITAIIQAIKAQDAYPVLMTTSKLRNSNPALQEKLKGINELLRQLATEMNCGLADVNRAMDQHADATDKLLVEDGVHPNFQGHLIIARTVLNSLGYQQITLPERFAPEVMPGVITQWHSRPAGVNEPELNESIVREIKPQTCVGVLNLPGAPMGDVAQWLEQERASGFAVNLHELIAPGQRFFSMATVHAKEAGPVFMKAGAGLKKVYLNGQLIYSNPLPGWHAGRDGAMATLKQGDNTLVIESGRHFFVSLTNPVTGESAITTATVENATVTSLPQ